jgi:hypothetical protein
MAKMSITITPNGDVKIQIEGIKGKKCVDFSKAFEEALGEVSDRKFTSEYYQEESIKKQDYLKEKR